MDEKVKEAISLLSNSKSKKRLSGAKRLRKLGLKESGIHILKALEKEINDVRTWETQYHLIYALGHTKHEEALPFLKSLAVKKFDATILYYSIGDSIFRLSIESQSLEDSLKLIYAFSNKRN